MRDSSCVALGASLSRKEAELLSAYSIIEQLKVYLANTESHLSLCQLANPVTTQQSRASTRHLDANARVGTQHPAVKSLAARQPRTLLQAEADAARPCSKTEIGAVLNANADRMQVVGGLFSTNPACAMCIVLCKDAPGLYDAGACILRCHNQNENSCGSQDLARMEHLLMNATLDDRPSLIRMLELAEASCAYCILSTYESVCGEGCIDRVFHLVTDFPVIPRACLPELASSLASVQAAATRVALRALRPIGLTLPVQARATDIYAAVGEPFGGWPVYRGVHQQKYMFHCDGASTPEVWAISFSNDRDVWSTCEAELWISFDAAQVRTDLADPSRAIGGVHSDLSVVHCHQQISTFGAGPATLPSTLEPENLSETVTFPAGVVASDVACYLMLRLGPHNMAARSLPVLVRLPSMGEAIELVSDILVREGEFLRIESPLTSPVTLILRSRRLRVESGGRLDLYALKLADSVGGSAVVSTGGDVRAKNCTFARCATSASSISMLAEDSVARGDGINHPQRGAFLGASGGAIMLRYHAARLTAVGCSFEANSVSGAGMVSWGGAVVSAGSKLLIEDCVFRANVAEGNARTLFWTVFGGAIALLSSQLDMLGSRLIGNEARGPAAVLVSGGAILALQGSRVNVSSSSFGGNVARGSRRDTSGGAIKLRDSTLVVTGGEFVENTAIAACDGQYASGGAIESGQLSVLTVAKVVFLSNGADGGLRQARGGAIGAPGGRIIVGVDVIFRNNSVSNSGIEPGGGGAIGLYGDARNGAQGLSDFFADHGPTFVHNEARGTDPAGGALYLLNTRGSITGATFDSNAALTITGYGYGGAIAVNDGSQMRLKNCRITRNLVQMQDVRAYSATGGGISVSPKGTLTVIGTYLSSNWAGGLGLYESGISFAHVAKENMARRSLHLANSGHTAMHRCTFEGEPANDLANGGASYIVGQEFSHLVLNETSAVGSVPEGLLRLFDAAQAAVLSCRVAGVTIENSASTADGRNEIVLGILNSTFEPALPSALSTIVPPNCGGPVAGLPAMCDPRATCKSRDSGGVACSCVGSGLRYKRGVLEDGQQCEQDTSLRAVLESESLSIDVEKPSSLTNRTLTLIVEAQGETELNVTFEVTMTHEEAGSKLVTAANRVIRVDRPLMSAFGHHIEWKLPPPKTWKADLDASRLKFTATQRHEFTVRLACNRGEQSCAADGDIITTAVRLLSPQDSHLRSEVSVQTRVAALVSCNTTLAWVTSAGLELQGHSVVAEREKRSRSMAALVASTVQVEASTESVRFEAQFMDVDALPINFSTPKAFVLWANQSFPLERSVSGSNRFHWEIPFSLRREPGMYAYKVILEEAWDEVERAKARCTLLEGTLSIGKGFDTTWVLVGSILGAILLIGLALLLVRRHHQHLMAIVVMLVNEIVKLGLSLGLEIGDIVTECAPKHTHGHARTRSMRARLHMATHAKK